MAGQQGQSYLDLGLSASDSSGASQSGATSQKGGGNYGGTPYGPGSLINLSNASGANFSTPVLITLAVIAGIVLIFVFRRHR